MNKKTELQLLNELTRKHLWQLVITSPMGRTCLTIPIPHPISFFPHQCFQYHSKRLECS